MLFQTEKLSSFHCCKLWILLYFIVNIESITAFGKFPDWELRCEPPMHAPINGMVRCTKSNLIGSECYFGCKAGYELTSTQSSSLCSYDFVRLITKWTPPSPPECIPRGTKKEDGCYGRSRIDMVFVLDGSGSISSESFEHVLTWTKKVGEHMIDVFDDHLHIGIVQFASKPQVEAKLQIFPNTAKFDVEVGGINQLSGGTYTVDAMNKALVVLNEDRPKCPFDYQKIMVLLTDGYSSQPSGLWNEASDLQDAGVISFAVGVGKANHEELEIIANGHKDRIFNVTDFDFLHEHAHNVHAKIAQTLEITCDPPRTAPENGNVSCTHANELGSECKYTCDTGYKISDPLLSTTYCKIQTTAVGGWSSIPPTCIPKITCEPRTAPENGDVSCTRANELGSYCRYTCDAGYAISNPSFSTTYCSRRTADVAGWTRPPPACIHLTCEPPRTAPENGDVSCTHANELGSECTYTCDEGYFISYPSFSTTYCSRRTVDVARWTRPPPTCIPNLTCEPPRTAPENGDVSCTRANKLGSECRYTCDAGYTISDPLLSTTYCWRRTADVAVWTRPPPTCISKIYTSTEELEDIWGHKAALFNLMSEPKFNSAIDFNSDCEDKDARCAMFQIPGMRMYCSDLEVSRDCPKSCGLC